MTPQKEPPVPIVYKAIFKFYVLWMNSTTKTKYQTFTTEKTAAFVHF
jgi:hypothetical protein